MELPVEEFSSLRTQVASDCLRFVIFMGYRFTDRIVFGSEVEFEHASTGEEDTKSVELATLDFFWKPEMNFRAGLQELVGGAQLSPVVERPWPSRSRACGSSTSIRAADTRAGSGCRNGSAISTPTSRASRGERRSS